MQVGPQGSEWLNSVRNDDSDAHAYEVIRVFLNPAESVSYEPHLLRV